MAKNEALPVPVGHSTNIVDPDAYPPLPNRFDPAKYYRIAVKRAFMHEGVIPVRPDQDVVMLGAYVEQHRSDLLWAVPL